MRLAERGMVLPLTMIFLVILAALSVGILTVGSNEVTLATNYLRQTQALFLAEAGLEDAFNVFRNSTSLLTSSVPTSLTSLSGLSGPGSALSAVGSYTVKYQAAGGNTVRVVSTGLTSAGFASASKTMRALFSTGFTSNDAIRTKENLLISGSLEVEGNCGNVHSNGDVTVSSGGAEISQNVTATGTATVNSHAEIGGSTTSGASSKTIPTVDAAYALTSAQSSLSSDLYQMMSDGRVLDKNGTLLTTVANNNSYRNWTYVSGTTATWKVTGSTGSTGTYYIQGNAEISGSPGSSSSRWQVSVIATGNIQVAGSPYISAHLTDTLLIAGGDIKINGNAHMQTGVIAAHEQIEISGNADITGYVIAEGAASSNSLVTEDKVTGNAEISFSCGLSPPIQGPLTILAWGS